MWLTHQLEKYAGCKVLQFIHTMKIQKLLGYKTLDAQTQQLLQEKDELGTSGGICQSFFWLCSFVGPNPWPSCWFVVPIQPKFLHTTIFNCSSLFSFMSIPFSSFLFHVSSHSHFTFTGLLLSHGWWKKTKL